MPDRAKQQKLSSTSFVYPVRSLLQGRIQPHSEAPASPGPSAPGEPPSFFNFIQDTRRSPGSQVDVVAPGEVGASLPVSAASGSRVVDSDNPHKRRTRKRTPTAASAVLDPDTPRTGNDSEPTRVHTSRRRKSARKPSPNFRHFPAGDQPDFPRSFSSTILDQSTPTLLSAGNMETVPTAMSAAYFLGHRNSAALPSPPIPSLSGQPSSSDEEPQLPFNPSEYGLVHLPPIPSSASESGRAPSASFKTRSGRSAPTLDTRRVALGSMAPITSGLVNPEPANSSAQSMALSGNLSNQGSSRDLSSSGVSNSGGSLRPTGNETPVEANKDDKGPQLTFNPSEFGLVQFPGCASSTSSKPRSGRSAPISDTRQVPIAPITSGLVSPVPAISSSAQTMALSKNDSSQGSSQDSGVSNSGGSLTSDDAFLTFRFRYHQDENGHHVIVGREGKLQSCEDEPIRTPGAVQGFGVLIAVDEVDDALVVRQVSEVCLSFISG